MAKSTKGSSPLGAMEKALEMVMGVAGEDKEAVTELPKGWRGMDKDELREIRKTAQIMRRYGKNKHPGAFLFLSTGHWPITMEQLTLEVERLHKKLVAVGVDPLSP